MAKSKRENYYSRAGRRPVMSHFSADDHEKIREAAFVKKVSMSEFVSASALRAAEKLLKTSRNSA